MPADEPAKCEYDCGACDSHNHGEHYSRMACDACERARDQRIAELEAVLADTESKRRATVIELAKLEFDRTVRDQRIAELEALRYCRAVLSPGSMFGGQHCMLYMGHEGAHEWSTL